VIDQRGETVTPGVREMACRENQGAFSFDKAAENLARTAQIKMSGEQLRLVVEAEGRHVQAVQQAGTLATAWSAHDCPAMKDGRPVAGKTRVYTGSDGVMVPVITQAEKQKRRAKVKEKRRKCGKKRRPLPPLRKGTDQAWKEFKVVYFYDEILKHQHVAVTYQNHAVAGRLMRREADRLAFRQASERIANVDGAPWIREQLQYHLAELDGWAWTSITSAKMFIGRDEACSATNRARATPGPTKCCTGSNTTVTRPCGSVWCNGGRNSAALPRSGRLPTGCCTMYRNGRR